VQASLYGAGKAAGSATFSYKPGHGTYGRFQVSAINLELPLLVYGLTRKTNHLEGKLHVRLELQGNSSDKKSWRGGASASLRDGLIWEIPVFGVFSELLNAIIPGAGTSRAREAEATFFVTNGTLCTDDLEIRAFGYRLRYRGCVDSDRMIDARVEAAVLRDTWAVGRILSLALTPLSKLLEYRVTGPLNHPVPRPVFIPSFVLQMLRPFHALKQLLPGAEAEERRPAPLYMPNASDSSSWK
jgi:hypothetical protein